MLINLLISTCGIRPQGEATFNLTPLGGRDKVGWLEPGPLRSIGKEVCIMRRKVRRGGIAKGLAMRHRRRGFKHRSRGKRLGSYRVSRGGIRM